MAIPTNIVNWRGCFFKPLLYSSISMIPATITDRHHHQESQYHLESNMLHDEDKADHEATNATHPGHEPEDCIDVHTAW